MRKIICFLIFAISIQSVLCGMTLANSSFDDALVGYWKLDENEQVDLVSDFSESGLEWSGGTIGSDVQPQAEGVRGTGAMFNKTHITKNVNNNINLGTIPEEFVGASEITFSAWIKPKGYFYYQSIFSFVDSAGNLTASLAFESSTLKLFATNNRYPTCAVSGMFSENKWSHVAMTIKMSSGGWDVQIFVDGVKCATHNGWGIYFSSIKEGTNVFIGAENNTDARNTNDFNGIIDEVRLYDKVASEQEIQELYNGYRVIATVENNCISMGSYNTVDNIENTVAVKVNGAVAKDSLTSDDYATENMPSGLIILGAVKTATDTIQFTIAGTATTAIKQVVGFNIILKATAVVDYVIDARPVVINIIPSKRIKVEAQCAKTEDGVKISGMIHNVNDEAIPAAAILIGMYHEGKMISFTEIGSSALNIGEGINFEKEFLDVQSINADECVFRVFVWDISPTVEKNTGGDVLAINKLLRIGDV